MTVITGHAALFDAPTLIGGAFYEVIARGAFTDTLRTADVRALFNHDPNYVLGRTSSGTLTLREDRRGLVYEITVASDSPLAQSVISAVTRADIAGASFAFQVDPLDEVWTYDAIRKSALRTIYRVSALFDISPTTFPAYAGTSATVGTRAATRLRRLPVAATVRIDHGHPR
jgi:HK97 family phage prohead protease